MLTFYLDLKHHFVAMEESTLNPGTAVVFISLDKRQGIIAPNFILLNIRRNFRGPQGLKGEVGLKSFQNSHSWTFSVKRLTVEMRIRGLDRFVLDISTYNIKLLSIFSERHLYLLSKKYIYKPVTRAERENWLESLTQLSSTNVKVARTKCRNFMTPQQRAYLFSDDGNFKQLFLNE